MNRIQLPAYYFKILGVFSKLFNAKIPLDTLPATEINDRTTLFWSKIERIHISWSPTINSIEFVTTFVVEVMLDQFIWFTDCQLIWGFAIPKLANVNFNDSELDETSWILRLHYINKIIKILTFTLKMNLSWLLKDLPIYFEYSAFFCIN